MTTQEVLKECTVEGMHVKLPDIQLERPVYLEVKKRLERVGGKWKGGKAQAFVFEDDPSEYLAQLAHGHEINLKQEFQFFETPLDASIDMALIIKDFYPDSKGLKFLEPSAGRGSLIYALSSVYVGDSETVFPVDCFEVMPGNRKHLDTMQDANLIGDDFLQCDIVNYYDAVIANPPFNKNQDIDHIKKMFEVVKPGGVLVTLAGLSWTFGTQKKQIQFRDWLEEVGAEIYDLNPGTFKDSGTMVAAKRIVIYKKADSKQLPEPELKELNSTSLDIENKFGPSLKFIKLSDITPSALNPRKEFDQAAIDELVKSILKVGVIQPVTVRPNPTDATKYELVCGERRYRAATAAGTEEVPASIRELTDAEAMELMVTENLQRKDVHPLEEADAFQMMIDKMGYQVVDVAAKIGKNEYFVIRRLQLNKMLADLKSIFKSGDLSIGHAELLSRLNDQQQLLWFKDVYSSSYNGGQGTIAALKSWLKNNTEKLLKDAPFKTDFPYEGKQFVSARCTVCPMNSAYNNSLFPDTADEAICHDPKCFQGKCNADFDERLQKAINDPNVVLVNQSYGDNKLEKKLTAEGHLVLSGYDSFTEIRKPDKKSWQYQAETEEEHKEKYQAALDEWNNEKAKATKAFVIEGYSSKGTYIYINIKPNKDTTDMLAASEPSLARKAFIEDIEQKRKRGREIDAEKVMKNLVATIRELPVVKEPTTEIFTDLEINALAALCYERGVGEDIKKQLGLGGNIYTYQSGALIMQAIEAAPLALKLQIIRKGMFTAFSSIAPTSLTGVALKTLAKDWCLSEYDIILLDQEGIRDRREAKLDQKIKDFDKQHNITA